MLALLDVRTLVTADVNHLQTSLEKDEKKLISNGLCSCEGGKV